jgi:hypothetical protein
MLVVERPVEVGNSGFGYVYLVFEDMWGGYKEYWDYFYSEDEANDLVDRITRRDLQVERVPCSLFMLIKHSIEFRHGGLA